jgi:CRISPR system Cascade subunit CasE
MFMSKIILHWPSCRNPYQWHRLIWQLFDLPDSQRNFQFACLERMKGADIPAILFSMDKPVRLKAEGVTLAEPPKDITGIKLSVQQELAFRLVANPTKVVTEQNNEKRKIRVPLIKEEQQLDWLKRHLNGLAEIVQCTVQKETPLYFNRKGKGGKIVPVLFQGKLRIVEPELFIKQIYKKYEAGKEKVGKQYNAGIGPGKAFGCGLMLVKKV